MQQPRRVRAAAALVAGILAGGVTALAVASPAQAESGPDTGNAAALAALQKDHKYRNGVVPTRDATVKAQSTAAQGDPLGFPGLEYYGGTDDPAPTKVGVQTGSPKVYLVYWGSQWGTQTQDGDLIYHFTSDTADTAGRQQWFYKGLGTNYENWSTTLTQYCQGVAVGAMSCPGNVPHIPYPTSGSVLAGVWYDNAAPVDMAATAVQIAQEAVNAAGHFGNNTAGSNTNAQYIIVSPPGARPDGWAPTSGNTYCAWHSYNGDPSLGAPVPSAYGNVAFTNMPYLPDAGTFCGANFVNAGAAGALDGVTIVGGHEFQETVTDPFPYWASLNDAQPQQGGWLAPIYDLVTNEIVGAYENADLCAWVSPGKPGGAVNLSLLTGDFPVQGSWSNATQSCVSALAPLSSEPAVLYNPNNRNIEIYGIDGGNLAEKYWNAGNGVWSGWGDFGAFDTDASTPYGPTTPLTGNPAVFYNPNNRNIEVYAVAGGHLVEKYWNAANGQWSRWADFGGSLSGSPKVFYNPNNRNVEIYGVSGGHLVEKYWNAANGQWSGWNDLGGSLVADPSILYNPNNHNIEIYGSTGHLVEKYWNAGNGQWSGWNDFGGNVFGAPTAFYNPNNRNIEIYYNTGGTGHLIERYWNYATGQWSPSTDLLGSLAGDPTVLYNPNNRNVEIYGTTTNGSLTEKYWNASNGQWSGWNDFGGTVLHSDPTVLYDQNNRNIEIYAQASGHYVEKYWNASNSQWSGWNVLS